MLFWAEQDISGSQGAVNMSNQTREIKVFPDSDGLATAAAELFVEAAQVAIEHHGRFSVALAGGSTPKKLYRLLGTKLLSDNLDWQNIHIFFGDERNVSQDHPESNFRMARESLLSRVALPTENIHPMTGGEEPQLAADRYEALLQAHFKQMPGRFDLVLLGMGDDGHTASLFPGSDGVGTIISGENDRFVLAHHIKKLSTWRLTLTSAVINKAAKILFLVTGANKAQTLRKVLHGPFLPEKFPAQLIRPDRGQLIWMLDEPAAHLLDL